MTQDALECLNICPMIKQCRTDRGQKTGPQKNEKVGVVTTVEFEPTLAPTGEVLSGHVLTGSECLCTI